MKKVRGELHRKFLCDGGEVQGMKAESTGRSCLIVTYFDLSIAIVPIWTYFQSIILYLLILQLICLFYIRSHSYLLL
jgi:hypothetical protein